MMARQLERPIREVITEFPGVQIVLDRMGIGCATCAVGTCLLGDIIDVHGLSVEQERDAMRQIAAVIFPGTEVEIPPSRRKAAVPSRARVGFSPPIRSLVDEHLVIKRLLALVPVIGRRLSAAPESGRVAARESLEFIRGYADRFHHLKEEDILFSYFPADLPIIQSMRAEHDVARAHVRKVDAALAAKDDMTATSHLSAYGDLLTAHIRKEDEVLYPYLDSRLSMKQVGEMHSRFAAVSAQFGNETARLMAIVDSLEESARR